MNPDEISNIIQAVSVALASLAIIVGVDAWRREFIGKRKIELAEDVLHAFYEARDAIARIRAPVMTQAEVEEVREEFKDNASSPAAEQARAVFTRYDKESDVFNRLHAMRYRVMARISNSAAQPFEDLQRIVKDIWWSSRMLQDRYWPRQGHVAMTEEEKKKHRDEMFAHKAVIWGRFDPQDPVQSRVETVVANIETLFRPVIDQRPVGFILTDPIFGFLRKKK
jgi:hypothetical protein